MVGFHGDVVTVMSQGRLAALPDYTPGLPHLNDPALRVLDDTVLTPWLAGALDWR